MKSLRLVDATFSFGERRVLDGVHLHLVPGWTGLVGPNGAGKTTLLRILSGALSCSGLQGDADRIVHYLDQRLDQPSDAVARFAEAWDKRALRLQSRLELDPGGFFRWSTLSLGERRRWQVAAARWVEPDVLLLDEPDNHLDADAREALVRALRGFAGVGVLVSHDRQLLDAVTIRTARIEHGRVEVIDAPWSEADQIWKARQQVALEQLEQAQADRDRSLRQLQAATRRQASASRSRSLRGVDPRDHDARSMARKHAAAKAEAAHSRTVSRQATRHQSVASRLEGLEPPEDLGRALHIVHEPCPRRVLAHLDGVPLLAGPNMLVPEVRLTLERGARVWLRGANGAGKSTLVRLLLDTAQLPNERVLYVPQELREDDAAALLRALNALPPEARGATLSLVAALGIDPARLLATSRPSPGEARKLAVAMGLGTGRWLLVLDEPTHHLDLPSRQRLQAALEQFEGALLLVTHDAKLGATCSVQWMLSGGSLHVLSCSAALTHDLATDRLEKPWQIKTATALVTALALGIALSGNQSVFHLVIMAWSALASAFAPLLTIYVFRRRLSETSAILVMIIGVGTAIGWRLLGWHNMVYEGLPGILLGLLVAYALSHKQKGEPEGVTVGVDEEASVSVKAE